MRSLVCLTLLTLAAASPAHAAYDPNITARERAFAASVQAAIKREDSRWIAENMRYPIRVCVGAQLTQIKDKTAFLRDYSQIVDDRVRKNVAAQDLNTLTKNFQGVLLGGGSILIYDDGSEAAPEAPSRSQALVLNAAPTEETRGHPLIIAINNSSVDFTSRRPACS
ncbi:MAG: hypothetical protein JWM77_3753 [Rhodospirillales bacterium]|nr:hypothetical protein [Rhodospirillales bacterium]